MSRTNIPFWVWKRGSPTFFDLGIFLNIDLEVVLCLTWRNFCQFWDQFLTDRIFWATFPKHSQNKCFYHVLILSTTVKCQTFFWNLFSKKIEFQTWHLEKIYTWTRLWSNSCVMWISLKFYMDTPIKLCKVFMRILFNFWKSYFI